VESFGEDSSGDKRKTGEERSFTIKKEEKVLKKRKKGRLGGNN